MKNYFRKLPLILLFYTLFSFQITESRAQIPCDVQAIITPEPSIPMTYSFVAYLYGDSSCFMFNPNYTWTIYGNPNQTFSGQQATYTFTAPGTYYVCVQAAYQGIISSWCDTLTVLPPGPDCTPSFLANAQGLTVNFSLNNIIPPSCYDSSSVFYWSFGDSSVAVSIGNQPVNHTYPASGSYQVCVIATAGNGQAYNACATISVSGNPAPGYLGGMVLAGGNCLPEPVLVEMYGVQSSYYQSMTINGGPDSCYYWFPIPFITQPVQYIVRATPLQSMSYLPTYYGGSVFWGDATLITPQGSNWNYHINLAPVFEDSLPALGTVGGTITGNGTTISTIINGLPVSTEFNVQACRVIILNSQNQPVAFATVGSDGTYSISGLPAGTYSLKVDHPKVPAQVVPLVIAPGSANAVQNFTANSSSGVVSGIFNYIRPVEISFRPNPADDRIYFGEMNEEVLVFNAQGRLVMKAGNTSEMTTKNLPSGIYQISCKTISGKIGTGRLVKK